MTYHATLLDDPSVGRIALLGFDSDDHGQSLVAQIAIDRGSNLFDITHGGTPLIVTDRSRLASGDWTGCFTLFPYPNRIRDKRFVWQDRTIDLTSVRRREGSESLVHGPIDEQAFRCDGVTVGERGAEVTTWFDNVPGGPIYQLYPFSSRLSLTYRLTATSIAVEYQVRNNGGEPLPYGFALHPCFSAPAGTKIIVPADLQWKADVESLPTGLIPMGSNGYDLRQPTLVTDVADLDTVFTGMFGNPELQLPDGTSVEMAASSEFKNFVVYTQSLADGGFVCGENQTGSADFMNLCRSDDAEVRRYANQLSVAPGQMARGSISYLITRG